MTHYPIYPSIAGACGTVLADDDERLLSLLDTVADAMGEKMIRGGETVNDADRRVAYSNLMKRWTKAVRAERTYKACLNNEKILHSMTKNDVKRLEIHVETLKNELVSLNGQCKKSEAEVVQLKSRLDEAHRILGAATIVGANDRLRRMSPYDTSAVQAILGR